MDDDPAGWSGCVGPGGAPAIRAMRTTPRAERPAALDLLSAPVFWLGSRGVLHHQPFQIGGDAAVLCHGLLDQQCFEFRRHLEIDIDGFPHVFHQIILAKLINVLYHTLHDYPTQGVQIPLLPDR